MNADETYDLSMKPRIGTQNNLVKPKNVILLPIMIVGIT